MRSIFFPFEQMVKYINYGTSHFIDNFIELFRLIIKNIRDRQTRRSTRLLYLFHLFTRSILFIFIVLSIWLVLDRLFATWIANIFLGLTAGIVSYKIYLKKKKVLLNENESSTTIAIFPLLFILLIFIAYNSTTKYYNEEVDITSYTAWWPLNRDTAHLYSGDKSGNYYKVVEEIMNAAPSDFKEDSAYRPAGGYENANMVMLDPLGIGFVQEDVYKDGDKIKEQINYIAPIYMEKLHIVFNKKSPVFRDVLKDTSRKYLALGFADSLLIEAIRKSRVAAGKTGSSTKIISNIVLSEINKKPTIAVRDIKNLLLADAIAQLRYAVPEDTVDIVFFMSGQPVDPIRELLKNTDSFGLIGIETSFVDAINKSHNSTYRYTDFKAKDTLKAKDKLFYGRDPKQYESLPTLGSYCYLIANRKVKPYLINKFMSILNNNKDSIPLDFFNTKDAYNKNYQAKKDKVLASFLLAISGGVALGTLALSFIFALISSIYHDKINNRLAKVIRNIPDDSIPDLTDKDVEDEKKRELRAFIISPEYKKCTINDKKQKLKQLIQEQKIYYDIVKRRHPLKTPYIKFYQTKIINENIVTGMSELVNLRVVINTSLNHGLINTEHFTDLLSRTDNIMEKLRKSLFLRLHELLKRSGEMKWLPDKEELKQLLLKYVTASYLNFEDYKKLKDEFFTNQNC